MPAIYETCKEVNPNMTKAEEKVAKEADLRVACEGLIKAFRNLFEYQELVKAAKETIKAHAGRIGLEKEDIKTLINLCKLRAKGEHKLKGDLVQQWLFDLEEEKKRIERLQQYLPPLKRLGVQ